MALEQPITNEIHYVLDKDGNLTVAPGDKDAAKKLNLPEIFNRDREAEMVTRASTQGYTLLVDDTKTMHEDVQ